MFGHGFKKSHPRNNETISSGIKRGANSTEVESSMELFSELSSSNASSRSYVGGDEREREKKSKLLESHSLAQHSHDVVVNIFNTFPSHVYA